MSPWQRILEQPQRRAHFVQLYDAEGSSLARNVSQYLWEGLHRGGGALVIATPEHWERFQQQLVELNAGVSLPWGRDRLLFLDAEKTLLEFMVGGRPDWDRFARTIRHAIRQIQPARESGGVRAYGEMVALLWKARQFTPAIRLEQFWNRLLTQFDVSLYCSYAIDVFSSEFHADAVDALLCTHTHLIPSEPDGRLEHAFSRALTEVLGPDAQHLNPLIRANQRPAWAVMPDAESMMLWIRKNLPRQAEEIFARARLAYREPAQAAATGTPAPASGALPA
jgi:hypothetical protein